MRRDFLPEITEFQNIVTINISLELLHYMSLKISDVVINITF
jgi:hypothetical protein